MLTVKASGKTRVYAVQHVMGTRLLAPVHKSRCTGLPRRRNIMVRSAKLKKGILNETKHVRRQTVQVRFFEDDMEASGDALGRYQS